MCGRSDSRHSIDLLTTFHLGEPSPDSVRLADGHRILEAVDRHGAHLADRLGPYLPSLSLVLALCGIRRKEQVGMVPSTESDGLPRTVESDHRGLLQRVRYYTFGRRNLAEHPPPTPGSNWQIRLLVANTLIFGTERLDVEHNAVDRNHAYTNTRFDAGLAV